MVKGFYRLMYYNGTNYEVKAFTLSTEFEQAKKNYSQVVELRFGVQTADNSIRIATTLEKAQEIRDKEKGSKIIIMQPERKDKLNSDTVEEYYSVCQRLINQV